MLLGGFLEEAVLESDLKCGERDWVIGIFVIPGQDTQSL